MKNAFYEFERVFDREPRGVGTEVFVWPLSVNLADRIHLWNFHLIIDFDKLPVFVVPQEHVVARQMFFDEIVFEHHGLELGGNDDVFEVADVGDQSGGFRVEGAFLKIATHPFFQIFRFADIDNLARAIFVQIHTGVLGNIFQFIFQLRHMLTLYCLLTVLGNGY